MTQHYIGTGFVGLLTLVFVIAKLWGKINWSWWWVFSPLWISALIGLSVLIIIIIIAIVVAIVSK